MKSAMRIFSGSFPSTSLHCVAMSTAALFLVFSTTSLFQTGASQTIACNTRCFSEYSSGSVDCDTINFAIECYYNHRDDCTSEFAQSQIESAEADHDIYSCPPVSTEAEAPPSVTAIAPTTESVTLPPPPPCPVIPSLSEVSNILTLAAPDTRPTFERRECIEYNPRDLQHCSMYGYSSLRPFRAYRNGLEVCNIPGSWFLLRHRTVTIEVEGVSLGANLDHTKLSKVNVTFYSNGSCLAETKSYVAFANSPLSPNFTDHTTPNTTNTCGSILQMNIDPSGTVVTLLAPWINTTIVIRRHADLLAVTLQVPGHLSFESDGLCRSCPAHTRFNMEKFESDSQTCFDENLNALFHCFAFANNLLFSEVTNISYAIMCQYNLFRWNSSDFGLLSFYKAVFEDAKLLHNYGNIPRRNFDIVEPGVSDGAGINSCNPPDHSNDTTDSIDTADRTTTTDTEDSGGRTTSRHSNTEQSVSTRDAGLNAQEVSSAIHSHQRQAATSLLAFGLLSAVLSRLLFR